MANNQHSAGVTSEEKSTPLLVCGLPYVPGPRLIRCAGCGCQLLRSPAESPDDPTHCQPCWLRCVK